MAGNLPLTFSLGPLESSFVSVLELSHHSTNLQDEFLHLLVFKAFFYYYPAAVSL